MPFQLGNLERFKHAMGAYGQGVEAKQRGQRMLQDTLRQLTDLGFQGMESGLERDYGREMLSKQEALRALARGGFDMKPEITSGGPSEPMLPTELQGADYQTTPMEDVEKYTPMQEWIKGLGITPGWQQKADIEMESDQAIIRAILNDHPDFYNKPEAERERLFKAYKFGYDYTQKGGAGGAGKSPDDILREFLDVESKEWYKTELGRAFSVIDPATGEYVFSGEKEGAVDALTNYLAKLAGIVPKVKALFPKLDPNDPNTWNEFRARMRPIIEDWVQSGGKAPSTEPLTKLLLGSGASVGVTGVDTGKAPQPTKPTKDRVLSDLKTYRSRMTEEEKRFADSATYVLNSILASERDVEEAARFLEKIKARIITKEDIKKQGTYQESRTEDWNKTLEQIKKRGF